MKDNCVKKKCKTLIPFFPVNSNETWSVYHTKNKQTKTKGNFG